MMLIDKRIYVRYENKIAYPQPMRVLSSVG